MPLITSATSDNVTRKCYDREAKKVHFQDEKTDRRANKDTSAWKQLCRVKGQRVKFQWQQFTVDKWQRVKDLFSFFIHHTNHSVNDQAHEHAANVLVRFLFLKEKNFLLLSLSLSRKFFFRSQWKQLCPGNRGKYELDKECKSELEEKEDKLSSAEQKVRTNKLK